MINELSLVSKGKRYCYYSVLSEKLSIQFKGLGLMSIIVVVPFVRYNAGRIEVEDRVIRKMLGSWYEELLDDAFRYSHGSERDCLIPPETRRRQRERE